MAREKVQGGVRKVRNRTIAPGIIENKRTALVQQKKMDRVRGSSSTYRFFESHETLNVTDLSNSRKVGERKAGTSTGTGGDEKKISRHVRFYLNDTSKKSNGKRIWYCKKTIVSTMGMTDNDSDKELNPKVQKNTYEEGKNPGTVRERKKYTEEYKEKNSRQVRFLNKMHEQKKMKEKKKKVEIQREMRRSTQRKK